MDVSEFYESFFQEAEELLNTMETQLLDLDLEQPDPEQLNAIFRAAHSIKGGAGTFGFEALQHATHLLENLFDFIRRGELALRRDLVDIFLETKDMLDDQLDAYRQGEEPEPQALERICQLLQRIAIGEMGEDAAAAAGFGAPAGAAAAPVELPAPVESTEPTGQSQAMAPAARTQSGHFQVALLDLGDKDRALLINELEHLGHIEAQSGDAHRYEVVLASSASAADIEAVMCFIADQAQLEIKPLAAQPKDEETLAAEPRPATAPSAPEKPAPKVPSGAAAKETTTAAAPRPQVNSQSGSRKTKGHGESSSLRVPVTKVDQIINLVGELIITQSMLTQVADDLATAASDKLITGINLLERNARDLQEAVMSVRMVPMDYVFNRFPRLVRDLAGKLDKKVELVTQGRATELDKSLTEQIIDPLTHLVRNSLDHGIESPDDREAAGKSRTGTLRLSAEHQGGNIVIEVADDGAGLDRDKILAKARERGLGVSETLSDSEVWQLIFAPGFSTAAQISDVSGRGVGMDVVKRNIEKLGGHVEVRSQTGQGTTIRILLPLTLAILDGMSVRVRNEIFILPVSAVLESLQPRSEDLHRMASGNLLLKVRGDYLPIVAIHEVMDVAEGALDVTGAIAVIVQGRGRCYALLVDELVGQQQVVVKNLETNYRKVPGVAAATILGDGSVALILDVNDLYQFSQRHKENGIFADKGPLKAPLKEANVS
jgi:two-component system chemotaxis sensor kinase CheA